jgi:hypothetical protein
MIPHHIYSCRIQSILELLAIAANITQAAHTRLNHVLLMLGNLFHIYSHPSLESQIKEQIIGSLKKYSFLPFSSIHTFISDHTATQHSPMPTFTT